MFLSVNKTMFIFLGFIFTFILQLFSKYMISMYIFYIICIHIINV